jgi:hypothetical protein
MIRKGILVDLARIPYSLDLSSPNLQGTVNGLIKPLETLTRIVIHPPGTVKDGKKTKPGGQDAGSQTSSEFFIASKLLKFITLTNYRKLSLRHFSQNSKHIR